MQHSVGRRGPAADKKAGRVHGIRYLNVVVYDPNDPSTQDRSLHIDRKDLPGLASKLRNAPVTWDHVDNQIYALYERYGSNANRMRGALEQHDARVGSVVDAFVAASGRLMATVRMDKDTRLNETILFDKRPVCCSLTHARDSAISAPTPIELALTCDPARRRSIVCGRLAPSEFRATMDPRLKDLLTRLETENPPLYGKILAGLANKGLQEAIAELPEADRATMYTSVEATFAATGERLDRLAAATATTTSGGDKAAPAAPMTAASAKTASWMESAIKEMAMQAGLTSEDIDPIQSMAADFGLQPTVLVAATATSMLRLKRRADDNGGKAPKRARTAAAAAAEPNEIDETMKAHAENLRRWKGLQWIDDMA